MVDVRMRQQDSIHVGGFERERIPVAAAIVPLLVHAAVNQQALPASFQQVTGASDIAGCSVET